MKKSTILSMYNDSRTMTVHKPIPPPASLKVCPAAGTCLYFLGGSQGQLQIIECLHLARRLKVIVRDKG